MSALMAGLRWLLFAFFLIAAVIGVWFLVFAAVLGATGDLP